MKIIDIQKALAERGFKPGPLDGVWGRQTAEAVRRFQAKNDLEVDGIVGPLTLAALLPEAANPDGLADPTLIWFKEAARLLGTREHPGSGSNTVILDWAKNLDLDYDGDDIPWCGLFLGHCIGATLDREPLPTRLLSARSWGRFGIPTKLTPGAVMVFWRKSRESGLGHVGFYAGENKTGTAYRILGGNQSDAVSLAWIGKERFVGARWPASVSPPIPHPVVVTRDEPLSWNEQ